MGQQKNDFDPRPLFINLAKALRQEFIANHAEEIEQIKNALLEAYANKEQDDDLGFGCEEVAAKSLGFKYDEATNSHELSDKMDRFDMNMWWRHVLHPPKPKPQRPKNADGTPKKRKAPKTRYDRLEACLDDMTDAVDEVREALTDDNALESCRKLQTALSWDTIEELRDEMEEILSNTEEYFSQTQKYADREQCRDELDELINEFENLDFELKTKAEVEALLEEVENLASGSDIQFPGAY